jgi:hypothetical protein
MKKINKLLLCLGLVGALSLVGCATAPKPKLSESPIEQECRYTCRLMAECSGRYSEHDLLMCGRECLGTPPMLRSAVAECSRKWLKSCNQRSMNSCVSKKLAPYRQK